MDRKHIGSRRYRLLVWATAACIIAGTSLCSHGQTEIKAPGRAVLVDAERAFSLALFGSERVEIERHLAHTSAGLWTSDERLVRLGDALSYHGITKAAAAAYIMALRDQGLTERTEAVAMRLAWCLAPLNTAPTCVRHAPEGPQFTPTWEGGRTPTREESEQAIAVYDLTARTTTTETTRARALLAMGWLHRATNQWGKSTSAWLRCAEVASETREARTAYWLAAENLQWNLQVAEAASILQQFLHEYPTDPRAGLAKRRIQNLEAEARGLNEWRIDPLTALRAEIEARSSERAPSEVYHTACIRLERCGLHAQLIEVSRWAGQQTHWPASERRAAHATLSSALLSQRHVDRDAKAEAVESLGVVIELAERDREAISAAAFRCAILRELGEFNEALATLESVEARTARTASRDHQLLPEAIKVFTALGDREAATSALQRLVDAAPNHAEIGRLRRLVEEGF